MLEQVPEKMLPESVPGTSPNTGYFAGGTPGPGSMSTVDKIDFTSDTLIEFLVQLNKRDSH